MSRLILASLILFTSRIALAQPLGCFAPWQLREGSRSWYSLSTIFLMDVRALNVETARTLEQFLASPDNQTFRLCLKGTISRALVIDAWWAEVVPVEALNN